MRLVLTPVWPHGALRLRRVAADVLQQRHRDVGREGHVELAAGEGQHAGRAVGDDGVFDAVEIGPPRLPVVGVLRELDALVHLELDELERARADRLAAHVRDRHMAGIDRRVARGEQRQQRGLAVLEMEGRVEIAVGRHLLDIAPPCRARVAPQLVGADQQVERAGHIRGRERLAVVPLHALPQLESELLAVLIPRPARGEIGHDRVEAVPGDVLVEHHQIVEQPHERHRRRDGRLLVDRRAGRRIHVLDFEHAAGFLCPAGTRRRHHKRHYARQRETPVLDFHVVSSQKLGVRYVAPSCKHRNSRNRLADRSRLIAGVAALTGTFALRIV